MLDMEGKIKFKLQVPRMNDEPCSDYIYQSHCPINFEMYGATSSLPSCDYITACSYETRNLNKNSTRTTHIQNKTKGNPY
jgi:hypothetical protein